MDREASRDDISMQLLDGRFTPPLAQMDDEGLGESMSAIARRRQAQRSSAIPSSRRCAPRFLGMARLNGRTVG